MNVDPAASAIHDFGRELELAASRVATARWCVTLVGAGISQESGIPTFRGAGGLWTRDGKPPMNGFQRFLAAPEVWWASRLEEAKRPDELAAAIGGAQPNAAHRALAELEHLGVLKTVITQNIDNLHQLAGSRRVLEIHGNRTLMRCIRCQRRFRPDEIPMQTLPPLCPLCDGIIKSDTVMFGEPIPEAVLNACHNQARRSDVMVIVGTSAVVYPAAELPLVAKRAGAALIEINPDETPLTARCDIVLRGLAGVALPVLVAAVRDRRAQARTAGG